MRLQKIQSVLLQQYVNLRLQETLISTQKILPEYERLCLRENLRSIHAGSTRISTRDMREGSREFSSNFGMAHTRLQNAFYARDLSKYSSRTYDRVHGYV